MSKIAVLLPCWNEAKSIAKVVGDFHRELPDADIWVFDNNSTDDSVMLAMGAGAFVRHVPQQGKGYVVRRMFREVEADAYVMVDADDTYPADAVHSLVAPILDGTADMVNGDRLSSTYNQENKRPGHNFGNALVCGLIRHLWGQEIKDVMTGYRAFSRTFVKTCPILSGGFEIETEMTLHAIDKRLPLKEIPIQYRDRAQDNPSKLHTIRDGFKVLRTIFDLFRFYRPEMFFGILGSVMLVLGFAMAIPVLIEYFRTGLVPRFPTLIVACFLVLSALLSWAVGLVLGSEKKRGDQVFVLLSMLKGSVGCENQGCCYPRV